MNCPMTSLTRPRFVPGQQHLVLDGAGYRKFNIGYGTASEKWIRKNGETLRCR